MPDMRSFDDLVARCESMQWGYSVACEIEYVTPASKGSVKCAIERWYLAEVSEPGGATITVDDAKSGHEALARAVGGMENVIAGRVTAGREG